jgi:hypothetical protein
MHRDVTKATGVFLGRGGRGGRRIFYLDIGDSIIVWVGGRIGERSDKLDFGCGS